MCVLTNQKAIENQNYTTKNDAQPHQRKGDIVNVLYNWELSCVLCCIYMCGIWCEFNDEGWLEKWCFRGWVLLPFVVVRSLYQLYGWFTVETTAMKKKSLSIVFVVYLKKLHLSCLALTSPHPPPSSSNHLELNNCGDLLNWPSTNDCRPLSTKSDGCYS